MLHAYDSTFLGDLDNILAMVLSPKKDGRIFMGSRKGFLTIRRCHNLVVEFQKILPSAVQSIALTMSLSHIILGMGDGKLMILS